MRRDCLPSLVRCRGRSVPQPRGPVRCGDLSASNPRRNVPPHPLYRLTPISPPPFPLANFRPRDPRVNCAAGMCRSITLFSRLGIGLCYVKGVALPPCCFHLCLVGGEALLPLHASHVGQPFSAQCCLLRIMYATLWDGSSMPPSSSPADDAWHCTEEGGGIPARKYDTKAA